jgi:hypothetical protein
MRAGLTITPTWHDVGVAEYRIEASNGAFCGTAHVYAQHESPRTWAKQLAGFPQHASDRRQLSCGSTDPTRAGGSADLRFSCINAAGHAALEIILVSERDRAGEPEESVKMRLKKSQEPRWIDLLRNSRHSLLDAS